MNLDDLIARAAINDTILTYTRGGDAGKVEDFVGCFAPDGVLEVKGRVNRGHDEIRAFVSEIGGIFKSDPTYLPARHHLASIWIQVVNPDEARAGSYFTLTAATGPDHWGTYRDQLVRIGDQWKFSHRRVKVEGARAGSPVADQVE